MAQTVIEIVNEALAQIGVESITALSDPTNTAKVASLMYPSARDAVLRMHTWGFATRRAQLTQSGITAFGNENRFSLPVGYLRIVELYNSTYAWRIENGELLTMDSAAYVKYIYREDDVTKFDALFTEALIYYLSSKLAHPLTRSQEVANSKYGQFTAALSAAMRADRTEEVPAELINMSLALLGAPGLTEHNDTQMQVITKIYESVRDEMLTAHPWNFALRRESVLAAGTTPGFGYSNAWIVPADCLRVLDVYDEAGTVYLYPWAIEGTQLLINLELSPGLRYVSKITDITKYPAEFTSALVSYLASKLASSVTKQPEMAKTHYELYVRSLAIAKQIDSGEIGSNVIIGQSIIQLGVGNMAVLGGEQAAITNEMYSIVRDEVLRAHGWHFAVKRITLENPTVPNHEFAWQYTLPVGCLRVLEVFDSQRQWKWRVEGTQLLIDDSPTIDIRYVERVTDISKFVPGFSNALVYLLASKLAMPLTQRPDLVTQNYELFQKEVARARYADNAEGIVASEIITQALVLVGISATAALEDTQVRTIKSLFTPALKEVLSDHEWGFAAGRAVLVEDLSVPAFGYAHKYALPDDCVRVVELYDSDAEWSIEGAYLLTDDDAANIIYTKYIYDHAQFSPLFFSAFVYNLASKYAVAMATNMDLQRRNYDLYRTVIDQARGVSARERQLPDTGSSVLIDVRR